MQRDERRGETPPGAERPRGGRRAPRCTRGHGHGLDPTVPVPPDAATPPAWGLDAKNEDPNTIQYETRHRNPTTHDNTPLCTPMATEQMNKLNTHQDGASSSVATHLIDQNKQRHATRKLQRVPFTPLTSGKMETADAERHTTGSPTSTQRTHAAQATRASH